MILATLHGDSFGQGAHALAAGENALVLFMLGLHSSVLILILFLVWFARRRLRQTRLPSETEALLDELATSTAHDSPSRPWERDADWWKPTSSDGS